MTCKDCKWMWPAKGIDGFVARRCGAIPQRPTQLEDNQACKFFEKAITRRVPFKEFADALPKKEGG